MNAKEAATHIDENGGGPLPLDVWAVIMKGLRLLTAIEDASGPTPEADAAICRYTGGEAVTFPRGITAVVPLETARRLERERNAALRALAQMRERK